MMRGRPHCTMICAWKFLEIATVFVKPGVEEKEEERRWI
jgi:hypothetical protein